MKACEHVHGVGMKGTPGSQALERNSLQQGHHLLGWTGVTPSLWQGHHLLGWTGVTQSMARPPPVGLDRANTVYSKAITSRAGQG